MEKEWYSDLDLSSDYSEHCSDNLLEIYGSPIPEMNDCFQVYFPNVIDDVNMDMKNITEINNSFPKQLSSPIPDSTATLKSVNRRKQQLIERDLQQAQQQESTKQERQVPLYMLNPQDPTIPDKERKRILKAQKSHDHRDTIKNTMAFYREENKILRVKNQQLANSYVQLQKENEQLRTENENLRGKKH